MRVSLHAAVHCVGCRAEFSAQPPARRRLPTCTIGTGRRSRETPGSKPVTARSCQAVPSIYTAFDYRLHLPTAAKDCILSVLSLYTILTYIYQSFQAISYLHVVGEVGTGKTNVLLILKELAFRVLDTSNVSGAYVFRTLHSQGGTALFDDIDKFLCSHPSGENNDSLESILLGGYKRGGKANRLVPVADRDYQPRSFEVYGCKAFTSVASLPSAVASRCIPIPMYRACW